MSDRERWIVYPLLLMALGLALQPKLVPVNSRLGEVTCEKLTCDELTTKLHSTKHLRVADSEGVLHAELKSTPNGGQFDIVRYTHGLHAPTQDRDVRMFASDAEENLIPLGVARLHWIAVRKSDEKPDANPKPSTNEPSADGSTTGQPSGQGTSNKAAIDAN